MALVEWGRREYEAYRRREKMAIDLGPLEYDLETFWENVPGEQERHGDWIIYPAQDEDAVVARVNPHYGADVARLFAAAPIMLEALESIENDDGHIPAAIWEMRNAAIAKARGEGSDGD